MEQTNDMFFPLMTSRYMEVGETFGMHANSCGFFTSWTDTITKAVTYDKQLKMKRDTQQKNSPFLRKKNCFLAIHGTLRLDIFNSQGYSILILPQWSKLMTCSFLRWLQGTWRWVKPLECMQIPAVTNSWLAHLWVLADYDILVRLNLAL